jgi:hypothetical protein
MVAYSFKARFAEPIIAGTKRQTIRAPRRRHAHPGEELQLYTGMRTKQCRLIGRATCESVQRVKLLPFTSHGYVRVDGLPVEGGIYGFARRDGFADWSDLCDFWNQAHPGATIFEGVLIKWGPLLDGVGLSYCTTHLVHHKPPGCPQCTETA